MSNPSHDHGRQGSPNLGNFAAECPREIAWCNEHYDEGDCCITVRTINQSCSVWLRQELPGIEPTLLIDTAPNGVDLTVAEAGSLAKAIHELRDLAGVCS